MLSGAILGVATSLAFTGAVQTNVPLFKDLTTLQLREFMLDSEVRGPKRGEPIFRKGDYTNSFFSIVDGDVMIEVGEAWTFDGYRSVTVRRAATPDAPA